MPELRLGRNKFDIGFRGFSKDQMPTISERQQLIQNILLNAEHAMDVSMNPYPTEDLDDGMDSLPEFLSQSSLSDSETSSLSSFSSSSSSSSATSSSSSSGVGPDSESVQADTDEEYSVAMTETADLLQVIMETRVLNPHEVPKCSQLHLVLVDFKRDDPRRFRQNLRVSPTTFDSLLEMVEGHAVFTNNSYVSQTPVDEQLGITLFRLGHNGNASSVDAVAQWAGVSAGTVVNCTRRVMIAFLALHDVAICWPSEEEKEEAKEWVESVSCHAWRDGFCMVDGTLVPLFEKPGHHGEAYFDRKSNYSLNIQVIEYSFCYVTYHLLMFYDS